MIYLVFATIVLFIILRTIFVDISKTQKRLAYLETDFTEASKAHFVTVYDLCNRVAVIEQETSSKNGEERTPKMSLLRKSNLLHRSIGANRRNFLQPRLSRKLLPLQNNKATTDPI